ncbi:Translation initiation factor 3 subunit J component, partial [Serendipita sp. 399]
VGMSSLPNKISIKVNIDAFVASASEAQDALLRLNAQFGSALRNLPMNDAELFRTLDDIEKREMARKIKRILPILSNFRSLRIIAEFVDDFLGIFFPHHIHHADAKQAVQEYVSEWDTILGHLIEHTQRVHGRLHEMATHTNDMYKLFEKDKLTTELSSKDSSAFSILWIKLGSNYFREQEYKQNLDVLNRMGNFHEEWERRYEILLSTLKEGQANIDAIRADTIKWFSNHSSRTKIKRAMRTLRESLHAVAPDWEQSSEEDTGSTNAAAVSNKKKKGALKQKLADKDTQRRQRLENGELEEEYTDLRDKYMDEKEMRRIIREKELEADLRNASDLFGNTSLDDSKSTAQDNSIKGKSSSGGNPPKSSEGPPIPSHLAPFLSLPSQLKTKSDFENLSKLIYAHLVQPQTSSPHYAAFVEQHSKLLCTTLKDTETRKVANVVAGVATEKAAEAKRAANAKKGKPGAAGGKGVLVGGGGGKGKHDLTAYDDDDFGDDPDDFM